MTLKHLTAAGLTAVTLLAGGSAAAHASTSVTAAVKSQDRAVRNDPAVQALKHFQATSPSQAKVLIPKLQAATKAIDHAATVVSHASATSATQREGQKDWVTGVRELGHGLSQLTVALQDVVRGDKAGAERELVAAVKSVKAGDVLGVKGDRLLGLKPGA